MTGFAAGVMQDAAMENPIIVTTDRNDFDGTR